MSEPRIPQGALRKPRSKYPVQRGLRTEESIEALGNGRYRCAEPWKTAAAGQYRWVVPRIAWWGTLAS